MMPAAVTSRERRGSRDFALVWGGQAVSQLGSRLYGVASMLWVLASTGSPARTGLVTSVTLAAYSAAQLPAGWLADRHDRRRVMAACDAAAGIAVASLGVAAVAGRFSLLLVLGVSVVLGAAWAVRGIAEAASLPNLVSQEALASAVGVVQTRAWVTGVLGPPLGGATFGLWHPLPFLLDAGSYLCALGCVRLVGVPLRSPAGPGSRFAGVREGLAAVRASPFIRSTALQAAAIGFATNASGLLVLQVLRHRSGSSPDIGIVFGAGSAGGCLGALLTPRLLRRLPSPRWALVAAPAAAGCGLVVLVATGSGLATGLGYAAIFALQPLWIAVSESRWLTLVPDAVRGRVRATVSLVVSIPLVVASVVTGWALEHLGTAATGATLGASLGAVALVALTSRALAT